MADSEKPQLYLITPTQFDFDSFPRTLQRVLDASDIACLRLSLASQDERIVSKSADLIREIAHERDIPLVIDTHVQLVETLGLDGVHLPDGGRGLRKLRETMGDDPILGADYVSFGPVAASVMGSGDIAEEELFAWWSDMIEVPVVAEGGLTPDLVAKLAPVTDFFAFGAEVWEQDDPIAALTHLVAPLR